MAEESKRACPICLDDFRDPKLLQCAHTFCRACLGGCTNEIETDVGITCPICRNTTLWCRDGIDGLLNNYFVPDTRNRKTICRICGSHMKVRLCMICEEILCLNCRSMHECVWKVDRANNPEADVTSQLLSLNVTPGKFKTVYQATQLTEFPIEFKDHESLSISVIVPINENEAWVVASNGPEVIRYDMLGNIKERQHVADGIAGGALSPSGRLFLLCLSLRCVVFMRNHKWYRFITFKKNISPGRFSILSDGRMVIIIEKEIIIDDDSSEESTEQDDSKASETYSTNERSGEDVKRTRRSRAILILDDRGNITRQFYKKKFDFRPCDVACCPAMDSICICDAHNCTVDVILSDGTLLGTYQGGNTMPRIDFFGLLSPRHLDQFKPQVCTVDSDGNFYIADKESKLIHVVSPTANLLGVVATDALGGFSDPVQIELDNGGKLWTGSNDSGTVRVFRITHCINEFSRPLFTF